MNVTEHKIKDRQPLKEGYSQMVSAERKENAKASDCGRITENNNIITALQTKCCEN